MKIALLSNIHGNSVALDAVLADIGQEGGADAFWILGDLVALGPDPLGVLERVSVLPDLHVIRGNTDRYVACGDRPAPSLEEARNDSSRLGALVEVANTFAWTQGMITAGGWLAWLRDLPLEWRVTLPDGTRSLAVHAAPGRDDGSGIVPGMHPDDLARLCAGCDASCLFVGHTHQPSQQRTGDVTVVNVGAVSLALTADRAASYVLLEATQDGHSIGHRSVAYDRGRVLEQLEAISHPGRGYIQRHLR